MRERQRQTCPECRGKVNKAIMCPRMGEMIGKFVLSFFYMIFVILEVSIPDDEKDSRKSELRVRLLEDMKFKLENDLSSEEKE